MHNTANADGSELTFIKSCGNNLLRSNGTAESLEYITSLFDSRYQYCTISCKEQRVILQTTRLSSGFVRKMWALGNHAYFYKHYILRWITLLPEVD